MNYIKKLQQQLARQTDAIERARVEIDLFTAHLHSQKFVGTEDGNRKDWISTGDVLSRLSDIRGSLAVEVVS